MIGNYKILNNQVYKLGSFSLVPIRFDDRADIMDWRNEQIYHLRQTEPLTTNDQENYFDNIVTSLFKKLKPDQMLFSLLENDKCIGYGGLVHINWTDLNSEISFIMNTSLEKSRFHEIWTVYLNLIEKVAFDELKFHKIYTYAFDLRPDLYKVLENFNFYREAVLKEHCSYKKQFIDVVIHSKINTQ